MVSKVIKPEATEKYRIENLEFPELDGPLPESAPRADSFTTAEYFRDRAVPRMDSFAPSFGPREKKPPREAEPPPLTPEEILEQANLEAASLVETARAEAQAIRDKAMEEGRAEGLAAGEKELEELKEDASQRLMGAAVAVEGTRKTVLAELEEELIQLVNMASSKVVAQELSINPGITANVVLAALKLISQTRWVKIRINPQDLEMVESLRAGIQAEYPDLAKVDLIPDEAVVQGGCMVITESEEIDDTVETRLRNMAREMDRVLKGIPDDH